MNITWQKTISKIDNRSLIVYRNIASSFLSKGLSIGTNFYLVPLTISQINSSNYGIWLTLTSVVGWLNILDVGLSNGLRNKLAESIANEEYAKAKTYIASTYALLFAIIIPIVLIFYIISPQIPWWKILNTRIEQQEQLKELANIVFISFCLSYILKPIQSILLAYQKAGWASWITSCGIILSLIGVLILKYFIRPIDSFITLAWIISLSPIITLIIGTATFIYKYPNKLSASFKYIDIKEARELIGVSTNFFIIQISFVLLFTTNNLIITQLLGPKSVAQYNIAFKLFTSVTIIQNIIISPYWSAFTNAYTRRDYDWIKKTMSKLNKTTLGLSILTVLILLFSKNIYKIWLNNKIIVPETINALLTIYVIISLHNTVYTTFINGTGKIRIQTIFSWISMILHLPLIYLTTKYFNLGLEGIISINIMWPIISMSLWKSQYNKMIKKEAV